MQQKSKKVVNPHTTKGLNVTKKASRKTGKPLNSVESPANRRNPINIYCALKLHLELSLFKSNLPNAGVPSPAEISASFSFEFGTTFGIMR